jgi:hypothetical protein
MYSISNVPVHAKNGSRIGCGIIERVSDALATVTNGLFDSGVTSHVSIFSPEDGYACYFGVAESLERDLTSFMNPDPLVLGTNCNFPNGCGVHIHNGTACTSSATQGGHYYGGNVAIDPWINIRYHSTDDNGEAYFTGCVDTGVSSFDGRPFVVHANNGSRVSCGLLQPASSIGIPTPPTPAMPTPPSPTKSSTPELVITMAVPFFVPFAVMMAALF